MRRRWRAQSEWWEASGREGCSGRAHARLPACLPRRTMVAQQGKCIKEWTAPGGSACRVRTPLCSPILHPSCLMPHASCLMPQVVEMDLRVEMVREWHSRLQGLLRLHIDSK